MRMKKSVIIAVGCFLLGSMAWADSLELKNGSLIKGRYMGGTENQISFQVGSSIQQYSISDVQSLTFDNPPVSSAPALQSRPQQQTDPAPPASSVSAVAPSGSRVTIPVGTRLVVRTIDAIDSDKNHVGDKFQATLDQALYINEVLVAPRGADVYGRLDESKEAGHIAGKAQLKLSLTGIVVNGQTVPLTTGDYELSGKSRTGNTAKKVGGGAAVGALIGAIAGGGKGAAIGAGVGAGAGTAVQVMTKGDQVHVPSETLLEFALDQPVTLAPTQAAQSQ